MSGIYTGGVKTKFVSLSQEILENPTPPTGLDPPHWNLDDRPTSGESRKIQNSDLRGWFYLGFPLYQACRAAERLEIRPCRNIAISRLRLKTTKSKIELFKTKTESDQD